MKHQNIQQHKGGKSFHLCSCMVQPWTKLLLILIQGWTLRQVVLKQSSYEVTSILVEISSQIQQLISLSYQHFHVQFSITKYTPCKLVINNLLHCTTIYKLQAKVSLQIINNTCIHVHTTGEIIRALRKCARYGYM